MFQATRIIYVENTRVVVHVYSFTTALDFFLSILCQVSKYIYLATHQNKCAHETMGDYDYSYTHDTNETCLHKHIIHMN